MLTYHSNLNYDRLVLQTTNLDLDNCPQLVDILGLVLPTNEQHIKIAACIKKTVMILSFSVKLALYFNYLRGCDIIHYIMLA